jgi:Ca2+-binding EF-hand superfamily protein
MHSAGISSFVPKKSQKFACISVRDFNNAWNSGRFLCNFQPENWRNLWLWFRRMDKDQSGTLSGRELRVALRFLKLHLNERQVAKLITHLDVDGDGEISIDEFMRLVWEGKIVRIRKKFHGLASSSQSIGERGLRRLFRQYDRDNSGMR